MINLPIQRIHNLISRASFPVKPTEYWLETEFVSEFADLKKRKVDLPEREAYIGERFMEVSIREGFEELGR